MSMSSFCRRFALALMVVASVSMTVQAQGRGGRGGGGGFGGGGRGGLGGMFGRGGGEGAGFALRSDVKKELAITEEQSKKLTELSENAPRMQDVMSEMDIDFRAMRDLSTEERTELMADVQKEMQKKQAKANEEVLAVLNSKQTQRFAELQFQYNLSNGSLVNAARAADKDLEASKVEALEAAQRDANAELQKEIAELRKKLFADALASVMGDSKIDDMMGEAFDFDAAAGRTGGFGRGGGGGTGGRAGGNARRGRPQGGSGDSNPRRRGGDAAEEGSNPRRAR